MRKAIGLVWAVFESGRVGTVVAGRFRLDRRIAVGGMGEVYRATHLDLGVPVAIKLVGPAVAGLEKAVARFRREARAAARLKSAHIVHVYDFGVDGGVPFLVMELLEGETLAERLERVGKVSLDDAVTLVDQAARGLTVAHSHGVVHRDVKPSNLFIARTPDGAILKVLDFGIAKPEEGDAAVTGSKEVLGSPLYMSPEQAQGEELDARTDVWSLAAVAFRALTGVDAFAGATTSSVLLKICGGAPPLASACAPELPRELDAVFTKAFARDIADRYRTSAELASALATAAGSATASTDQGDFFRAGPTVSLEPVTAAPPPTPRRSRWPWLALAGSLVTAAWFANRAPVPASPRTTTPNTKQSAPAPPRPEPSRTEAPAPNASASSNPVPVTSAEAAVTRRPTPKPAAKPVPSGPSPSAPAAAPPRRDPVFGL